MENSSVVQSNFHGANSSLISYVSENKSFHDNISQVFNELPPELTEISSTSLECIIAYCVIFIVAASGNALVFSTLWKKYRRTHSRITLLILHLTLADLIVCCTLIPTEIFWRLTIQWWGGNLLCKATQFLRAFGLYLSSLVLICVSFDRFLAIMFPMTMIKSGAYTTIKVMLSIAWICAAVFSVPQAIFFSVEAHPEYPSFKQCVTNDFLNDPSDVKAYSIFSVATMYFVPLGVIIFTYSGILFKLTRKSSERSALLDCNVRQYIYKRRCVVTRGRLQSSSSSTQRFQMRCSSIVAENLYKARRRTLIMTIVIVAAFVICWTPYAVMTLWYMIDWKGAAEVDSRIQEAFFLMAVANSCLNPIIYGGFTYRSSLRRPERPSLYC